MMLIQSTGHTTRHASHPVHMSSSSNASVLGSFFLAIGREIVGRVTQPLKDSNRLSDGLATVFSPSNLCYRPFGVIRPAVRQVWLVAASGANIIIPPTLNRRREHACTFCCT